MQSVDKGLCVDVVFLDMAKAFDKVPHQRLLEKLSKHGISGKILSTIGNWLRNRRKRVCLKGQWSSWHEVWNGVPQGSVLGPLIFLIYINDLEESVSGEVFKFADDTKIVRQVGDRVECDDVQRDLDIIVEWADRWQIEFNVDKCKVMHIWMKNAKFPYYMRGNILKEVEVKKDLGVLISADLKCSQQCVYACNKANKVMGMIRRTIRYREPRIMLSLYKTLVRPHVEYCSGSWNPFYKKDKEVIEKVPVSYTHLTLPTIYSV